MLTDKKAIEIAIWIAIDTEESLIDAYRHQFTNEIDETEGAVINARKNITAFRRVLSRYYPQSSDSRRGITKAAGRPISILKMISGDGNA